MSRQVSTTSAVVNWLRCLCLLWLAACSSTEKLWEAEPAPGPRPYEAISDATLDLVRTGILAYEAGKYERAADIFGRASREAPRDLRVAIWLQDATLGNSERRAATLGLPLVGGNSPKAQLRRQYRRIAEQGESPAAYLLAARLEDDQPSAELLLGRALELDPQMAWAHYALAHVAARGGDLGAVHSELTSTFELDPRHLPALRLLGWAQAAVGEFDAAKAAFEAWLERADEDWLATVTVRNTVKLDLALVYLSAGEPRHAMSLIDELAGERVDETRRYTAMTSTLDALGRPEEARDLARAAQDLDPEALLPVVQEALLLEFRLNAPWDARAAWRRVIELSGGRVDLAAGLQRFRAQVHLQRLNQRGLGQVP